jgi:hypothetical protein
MEQKSDNEYWQMVPKCLLGIRKTGNICMEFVSDDSIMYPCGIYMVLHKITTNSKQYMALEKSEKIFSIFILIEKKLIVLEERASDNKLILHFLDIESFIKIKSILTNFNAPIVDIKFSFDGSRMLLQNEKNMWPLSFWLYDKSRLVCSTNVIDHKIKPKHSVEEISFYPNSKNKVVVLGRFIFISYSIIDDNFIVDWEIRNTEFLLCHVWISSKELFLGNNEGQISAFDVENCHYDTTYLLPTEKYPNGHVIQLIMSKEKIGSIISFQKSDKRDELDDYISQKNLPVINTFVKFSRGIICLVDKKKIYFYKKDDGTFVRFHLVELPSLQNQLGKNITSLKF